MTKLIYRKTFALLLATGLLFSGNAWAVSGNAADRQADVQQKIADKKAAVNDNVCEKIAERADAFGQKMAGEENKFQTRNQERSTNWTEKKAENEAKLSTNREAWDANRDAQFKALEERAQTEEQKKAVTDFEAKVRAAIETRRGTVDGAIKTFQDGVQAAIRTRSGQVEDLLSDAATSRKALLDKAKADCAAGVDAKTVMANFRSAMQTNRKATQADKQNMDKVNTQVAALITSRKTTMEKALADFKATMEKARIELKKAFPTDTTTANN